MSAVQRSKDGRFLPGVSGNASGQPKDDLKRLREQALSDAIAPDDIRRVVQKLMRMVESHNSVRAAQLVLEYAVGKPRPMEDSSQYDGTQALIDAITEATDARNAT